ncbi:hypothetical protein DICVIV_08805, partial [Dictyocaulus viviparus]
MLLWIVALLPIETVVTNSLCVDGKDNVFRIYDTSKGKGKILLKNVEIGTYDKNKNPICVGGKPQFTLPGHFKLIKDLPNPFPIGNYYARRRCWNLQCGVLKQISTDLGMLRNFLSFDHTGNSSKNNCHSQIQQLSR